MAIPGTTDGPGRSFTDADAPAPPSPPAAMVSLRGAAIPASSADGAMATSLGSPPRDDTAAGLRNDSNDIESGLRERRPGPRGGRAGQRTGWATAYTGTPLYEA